MRRSHPLIALSILMAFGSAAAQTAPGASAPTPAAPAQAWSTADSTIGDLLDNPATLAVLQKDIPDVVNNPQIDQARGMTLQAIQPYAPTQLPDTVLAQVDADLAKVPPPATK